MSLTPPPSQHIETAASALPGVVVIAGIRRTLIWMVVAGVVYSAFMTGSKSYCPGGYDGSGGFVDSEGRSVDQAPVCVSRALQSNVLVYVALAAIFLIALGRVTKAADERAALRTLERAMYGAGVLVVIAVVVSQVWFQSIDLEQFTSGSWSVVSPFPLGIIDGITTNPSLLAKEPGDYRENLKRICQIVKGPTSAEVVATDAEGMIREGRDLAAIDEHIVVKVPFTREGVKACKALSSEGTRVNVTLVFSPAQALLAAKVGATYVSPFVGRLDDISSAGMELVSQIVEIYQNYEFTTEVLVASTRSPMHIVEAARLGADICTCPAKVIDALFNHPLTDIGLANFLKDWEKSQGVRA